MKWLTTLALALLAITTASAAPTLADMNRLLAQIDDIGNFGEQDFSCIYTIVTEKPGQNNSVTEAMLFRRDRSDLFLLLIRKPDAQKGQGYLKEKDNTWFYDPESGKFEHSSLSENVTDSKARNTDFSQGTLASDYTVSSWSEATLGNIPVYLLDLKAKTRDVAYDRMKIWVRKDVVVVMKSEEYGFSGNLMRTTGYFNHLRIGGKFIPSQILIVDEVNKGERTQVTLRNPSVNAIPDYVFTKSYLERVNK
jgi:outer membrane lipoprotein-sorting protein